jgi:cinnamoyl-CoA:phenyllactate CoA-transferase
MSMMLLGVQYDGQAHDYPISIYDNMNPLNGAYRTSDDRIIQCACPNYNDRFEPFMKSIGREDLIEAGKYFPQADMIAAGLVRELIDEIQKTFLEGDMKTMDDKLRAGDIPHSIAYSWEDIMNDPQAHAVGAFYDVTCPNGVVRKATHTPVRLESEGEIDGRTAPMIGEQGREVLKEVGYSDEKIDSMLENGTLYIWKDEE